MAKKKTSTNWSVIKKLQVHYTHADIPWSRSRRDNNVHRLSGYSVYTENSLLWSQIPRDGSSSFAQTKAYDRAPFGYGPRRRNTSIIPAAIAG